MSKREVSAPNAPQLAQLIQSRFHPFDSSGIGLRPTVPAQCLADLLERNLAAHRPFQHVRSDLADGLRGLPVPLPVGELAFLDLGPMSTDPLPASLLPTPHLAAW